jgi:hypothetical protein
VEDCLKVEIMDLRLEKFEGGVFVGVRIEGKIDIGEIYLEDLDSLGENVFDIDQAGSVLLK